MSYINKKIKEEKRMRNYKCYASVVMAAAMVTGNVFTAMAADQGGATGTGEYEGYVEETSVFSVDVPTDASATAGFDFFVDPNGLLAKTEYASKGGSADDFEAGSTLFFTRTPDASATPAVVKYGKDSEAITLTNKSSYDVNVEVSAVVSGADKIALGEVKDDTTDPTISLAIVSGSDTAQITADGGKLTGTIAGEDSNYEIKWDSTNNKYVYGLIADADEDAWKTYSFNLTGACGGVWTAAQAEVEPTVTLTWKVTDPKSARIMAAAANGDITYTFAEKPAGAITAFTVNGTDRMGAVRNGNVTYNAGTGVVTVKQATAQSIGLAAGGTANITIGDEAFTLTYTK